MMNISENTLQVQNKSMKNEIFHAYLNAAKEKAAEWR